MKPCVIDIYINCGRAKPVTEVWGLDRSLISTMSSFHNKSQLSRAVSEVYGDAERNGSCILAFPRGSDAPVMASSAGRTRFP